MTPENQPEKGLAKRAYGIIKAGGHSFKRATLGDIYTLIETRADEAREHREENFRYLNTKIDNQIGEVRQEIAAVNHRVDSLGQKVDNLAERIDNRMDALDKKIDNQIGLLRQEMNSRMDSLDRKIESQIGQVNKRLDTIMQILVDIAKK